MTDPQQQNNKPDSNEPDADQEKAFWEKLDTRIDEGIERAIKKFTKPSTSRNGGRKTIPEYLADVMGGPFRPVT